jgi:hypothetical protein
MKIDLKRQLKAVYTAKAAPALVDVPEIAFLMVDGRGDPNTSAEYRDALESLYAVAYAAKFGAKEAGNDFVVMPLEGLWWADDMEAFTVDSGREAWRWTAMIALPESVDEALVAEAVAAAGSKKPLPALGLLRFERFREGRAAQVLHVGPYAAEKPTIERLHDFIASEGLERRGKHHEVYLGDPRRTAPERLRTIIRQPVGG